MSIVVNIAQTPYSPAGIKELLATVGVPLRAVLGLTREIAEHRLHGDLLRPQGPRSAAPPMEGCMLLDSDGFAARAEKCRRLAEATDGPPLKAQFATLGASFLQYATHLKLRERSASPGVGEGPDVIND